MPADAFRLKSAPVDKLRSPASDVLSTPATFAISRKKACYEIMAGKAPSALNMIFRNVTSAANVAIIIQRITRQNLNQMAFVTDERLWNVSGITTAERRAIEAFIKSKVDAWITARGSDAFKVRDLLAGVDRNWKGTPLRALTDHYCLSYTQALARKKAGIALGRLVKTILNDDRRLFVTSPDGGRRSYSHVKR
jgi:hypothetical protein